MDGIRHVTDIPGYAKAHSPYSHAVVAGGLVHVSGQIAARPNGSGPMDVVGTTVQEQTTQALENVARVLAAAGSAMERVVKITVLLTHPEDFGGMNEAYARFFPGPKPARSVAKLGVELPGILVSIDAVALAGDG